MTRLPVQARTASTLREASILSEAARKVVLLVRITPQQETMICLPTTRLHQMAMALSSSNHTL